MFEDEELETTAVEMNKKYLYFMDKLKIAVDKKFKIISDSIFNIKEFDYDVVLALNIFHHFIKTEESHRNFISLLGRLNSKLMFFQAHNTSEGQMKDAYRNYEHEDFVKVIIENSCFNSYKAIGKTKEGRLIYKIKL